MSPAYWAVGGGATIDPTTNLQVNTLGVGGATAAGPAPSSVDGTYIGAAGAIDITRTDPANHAFRTNVDGDPGAGATSRFTMTAAGEHRWAAGDGSAWDVGIKRTEIASVPILQITGQEVFLTGNVKADKMGLGQAANAFLLSFPADTTAESGIDFGGDVGVHRSGPGQIALNISAATGGAVTVLGPTTLTDIQYGLMLNTAPAGAGGVVTPTAVALNAGGGARPLTLQGAYTIEGDPNNIPYIGINVNPSITLGTSALSNLNDNRGIQSVLQINLTTGVANYGNVGGTTDKLNPQRVQIALAASPAGPGGTPALGASLATFQGELVGTTYEPARSTRAGPYLAADTA